MSKKNKKPRNPYYFRIKDIAELSNKYKYWKLHQLGDIYTNQIIPEPLIDAWLIPLIDEEIYTNTANHKKLIENQYFDFNESVQVKLGIGQLPLLLPGTIFCEGYPVEFPRYFRHTFKFTPTPDNQKITRMGSARKTEDGGFQYYIPKQQHEVVVPGMVFKDLPKYSSLRDSKFGKQIGAYPAGLLLIDFDDEAESPMVSLDEYPLNQPAWYSERGIHIDDSGGKPEEGMTRIKGLIAPCMEVIRFYMTYSSQSCVELINGNTIGESNHFYNTKETIRPDENGQGGHLRLAKFMTDDDRKIVII